MFDDTITTLYFFYKNNCIFHVIRSNRDYVTTLS